MEEDQITHAYLMGISVGREEAKRSSFGSVLIGAIMGILGSSFWWFIACFTIKGIM